MTTNWNIHKIIDGKTAKDRRQQIMAAILARRKITPQNESTFFNPPHPSTLVPVSVGASAKAVARAIELIKLEKRRTKNPIVIYGDYDADGITSTAILLETLQGLGIPVVPFIPVRDKHGYGLSLSGAREVIDRYHPGLIITVDNGVTAIAETLMIQNQGINTIIIDHHQTTDQEHPTKALIHSTTLAGSGLTWTFANLLVNSLLGSPTTRSSLELAAIGTVADMVPLIGPNRAIVKHGLMELRQCQRIGLKALISQANLPQASLSAHHLGFHLAPRINAMGRLENAIESLNLLCTQDPRLANKLAQQLGDTNRRRQEMTDDMTNTAMKLVNADQLPGAIIISNPAFHEGVIGLMAGKIAQHFWRPTIIISEGQTYSKASARSIPGFNITAALRELDGLFEAVGGHPMAAGFTIKTKLIGKFIKSFTQIATQHLNEKLLQKILPIDAQIQLPDLSAPLMEILEQLHPAGIGNPLPVFSTANVRILDYRPVGNLGQHLKLYLEQNGVRFSAISFNLGDRANELRSASNVAIAYTPEYSTWNGRTRLELKLKDIKLSS